ncbi:MAG: hypothetical protein FWH02_02350 [Oscillospiraceae bacterium]|nr:hypothetical protein [Oscillospiraceae bacterium]
MQQKLFSNIKRMTGIFCACIVLITAMALVSRLTVLSGMAVAAPAAGLIEGDVTESGAGYTINSKIHFATPDSRGNVLITNKEANENYIRVDIVLDETGRSIYYSGFIGPGSSVNAVAIQGEPLDEGIYECTAVITVFDPDSRARVGEDEIPVTVYVGVKPDRD